MEFVRSQLTNENYDQYFLTQKDKIRRICRVFHSVRLNINNLDHVKLEFFIKLGHSKDR